MSFSRKILMRSMPFLSVSIRICLVARMSPVRGRRSSIRSWIGLSRRVGLLMMTCGVAVAVALASVGVALRPGRSTSCLGGGL